MDPTTTIALLKEQVKAFCEERDWDRFHSPEQLAIGAVTEAAELLELFRFKSSQEANAFVGSKIGKEKVSDEIADILFFLLRFAERFELDLSQAFARKMLQNELKYPAERARGKNLKYNEL